MNAADFPSDVIFSSNPDTVMITKIMLVINLELKQSVVSERLSFKPESEITCSHIPCLKNHYSLSADSPLILLSASNASCLVTFRMPSLFQILWQWLLFNVSLLSLCFSRFSDPSPNFSLSMTQTHSGNSQWSLPPNSANSVSALHLHSQL